jgi:hypothetical protein
VDDFHAVHESLARARRYLLDRQDADTWPADEEAAAMIQQLIADNTGDGE